MLDRQARALLAPVCAAGARRLAAAGVSADMVTVVGFAVGLGACVSAAASLWPLALVLWLGNRVLDSLDGPLARLHDPTARASSRAKVPAMRDFPAPPLPTNATRIRSR